MIGVLRIERAGPLCTIQDEGRFGFLADGVSASGPMDLGAYGAAGLLAGADGAGIEFTQAGIDVSIHGAAVVLGWAGGAFSVRKNGKALDWPGQAAFAAGDRLSITPGQAGNYGYLRVGGALELTPVIGSCATSTRARLGGIEGRALRAGDELPFRPGGRGAAAVLHERREDGPIRFIWGLHADRFSDALRERFVTGTFRITSMMDRMGVRLRDEGSVFQGESILSLVSDPILPGDIQILGDGTPIVLMRDHQPTGGYPRIGTIITADLDRFAQMRPGAAVAFRPVNVEHAQRLLRSRT